MGPKARRVAGLALFAVLLLASAGQSGGQKAELIDLSGFSGDPPRVRHVCAVAPDVLAVTIQARKAVPGRFVRYEPKPDDELKELEVKGSARELIREGETVGYVVGPEAGWLHVPGGVTGVPLQQAHADDPAGYRISSPDDRAYAEPAAPRGVSRKSKATDETPTLHFPQEHRIYLELPRPMTEGKTYHVRAGRLNLDREVIAYRHEPRRVRSEAVHVTQVGFRPDDPAKVAFLSLWMGTGGGYEGYSEGMPFHVIDHDSGDAVFSGAAKLSKPAKEPSPGLQAHGRNFNLADVYVLDFSQLTRPGTYRVYVEGVGHSYTFPISEAAWQPAFRTAARGFYHQRSGIALEEPYTDWTRPRSFHPDEGKKVYASTFRRMDSRGQGDTFRQLVAHRTDETLDDAWGGYFDAGDWDRHVGHLKATRMLLELVEMFPDYAAETDLNLPESGDEVPDLLDEALWAIDCYRRMQTPEGAIRGGIESESHPAPHETSWTDTLVLMAFAPDYVSSWSYAGVAARAAHCLETLGLHERARPYRDSALQAMEWAEAQAGRDQQMDWRRRDTRNLAALELYRLTGRERWHDLFKRTCGFVDEPVVFRWKSHAQRDAAFIYARLPEARVDRRIKKNALGGIVADGEEQMRFGRKTGFRWVMPSSGTPIGLSNLSGPHEQELLRAHFLTDREDFLRAAVLAAQFSAGANPLNMALTTGVGHRAPRNLLVVDAERTGCHSPPGLTPYGPMDVQFFRTPAWVTRWKLIPYQTITPPLEEWPVVEAYWDIGSWPMMCEFTVSQSLPWPAYAWGYLAARK